MTAHQAPLSLDSPGKNTGVGCHFLLQCMKVKSESEVAQSCLTLSDPMDCSPRGSSVHGIFQARVLEWGAIAFSGDIRDKGSIPGLGRSTGDGHGNPLQYSYLENPMNRGFWRATVHRVAKSRTRLKHLACLHIYFNVSWSTQAVSLQIKVIKIDLNTYAK